MDNEIEEIAFYLSIRGDPNIEHDSAWVAINNARIIKINELSLKSLTFKI
jgi:hypothetical protein